MGLGVLRVNTNKMTSKYEKKGGDLDEESELALMIVYIFGLSHPKRGFP